ncbi:MAG TPA: ACP S-malonyltransferase [Thiotrichales bacterium]|nr:MAG: [acyl-carrier-protein] S-malonyltransferase [Thiotrichales bacterium 16-46-22]HQT02025.1 ACP S-malonyltransferase [Thiotrichales bacterium]HQT04287.1 ACP S-malonyltransferase [Thiotrichales bacterium]
MTTAFVFPGQGSQSVGMLADMATEYALVGETFAEASQALGYDLWQVVANGPAETLNQTSVTQPAMLTAGIALYRILQAAGKADVSFMAGHSLGEYTALTAAGVFSLADAVRLVRARGEYMQSAVPEGVGAMAAILGLTDEQVRSACEQAAQGEVVSAVNFNSPGQVVIAGHKGAVERAMKLCQEAGAKRALPLPVSVPSHCALMQPAADRLAQELAQMTMQTPQVSVVNNVHVAVESDVKAIQAALLAQLYSPVRWVETVQFLKSQGVTRLVEVGPGKVLAGLNKRIDNEIEHFAVADLRTLSDYLAK